MTGTILDVKIDRDDLGMRAVVGSDRQAVTVAWRLCPEV